MLARPHLASRLERQRGSVEDAMVLYAALAMSVAPAATGRIVPVDPDDDCVIAAALAARADLIVAGNRHLLALQSHQGIRIVAPRDALTAVAS